MNKDNVKTLISERIAEERKAIVKHQEEFLGNGFNNELDGGFTNSMLEMLNLIDRASSLDEVKFAILEFVVAVKNNAINLHKMIREHDDRLDNVGDRLYNIEDRQREMEHEANR